MRKDVNHSRLDKKTQENNKKSKTEQKEATKEYNNSKIIVFLELCKYLKENISHTYAWVGIHEKHTPFQNILQ